MPDVTQLPSRASDPPKAPSAPESSKQIYTEQELEQEQARAISVSQEVEDSAGPPAPPEPKISTPIAFVLVGYAAILDTIGVVLVFFALDDFLILDILGTPLNFYLYIKGLKAKVSTITTLLELIPYVGALPLKTAGIIATIWIDRHPNSAAAKAVAVVPNKAPGRK